MPVDTKRLPAPEESICPYELLEKPDSKAALVDAGGSRRDGRTECQMRPIFLKAGIVSQAKGSAYIELNNTKLICAVYGPREVLRREEFSMTGQLNCELKFATFSSRKRHPYQPDAKDKEFSDILVQTLQPAVQLEKFPKARMDVFVTVLQDDGSVMSAAITCASVALADAGIEMYDLVVGCELRQKDGVMLVDPCVSEEYSPLESNSGTVTMGFMPSLQQVAGITQKGVLDVNSLTKIMVQGVEICHKMYPVLQNCLTKSVKAKSDETNT